MKIELYTKPSCQSCIVAKNYLKEHNIEYTEYVIDQDITREETIAKFPDAKVVPVVVIDDNWIGSKEELLNHLKD